MNSYRNTAGRLVDRAKAELASGDDNRLKYAALELRMAMEALTYDRALAYKDEFPEAEYDTWQPKKVLLVLLEIDANADSDSSFAFGKQPSKGERPGDMQSLGTEIVLNMATVKKHYDALGSYLHLQTVRQAKTGVKPDYGKVRNRCQDIVGYLDKVLSSPIWNITMGQFASFPCDCGVRVRRRLSLGATTVLAVCECGAEYDVEDIGEGKIRAKPRQQEAVCPVQECGIATWVPSHLIKPGTWWKCNGCGTHIAISLGLSVKNTE